MVIVRDGFSRFVSQLDNHDITCVFFNASYEIISTLSGDDTANKTNNFSKNDIIERIHDVKCNGSTDFNQIIRAIEELPKSNKKVVSLIASDGYHTNYNSDTINVRVALSQYFDYAIGIGNAETDFDKTLLTQISKKFIFGHNKKVITNILSELINITYDDKYSVIIPPQTKFVCLDKIEIEHFDEFVPYEDVSSIVSPSWICGNTQACLELDKINIHYTETETFHFLIVIDISASMDDFLDNTIVPYRNKDFFTFYNTKAEWYKLTTSDKANIIFYETVPENVYITSGNKMQQIKFEPCNVSEQGEKYDRFLAFCSDIVLALSYVDTTIQNQFLAEIYNSFEEEDKLFLPLKEYIQELHDSRLSQGEKKYNKFIKKNRVLHPNNNSKSIETCEGLIEPHLCIICFKNKRNVALNCYHISLCYVCATTMLNNGELKCPICRKTVSWLKQCRYINNNLKCLECNNKISVLHQKCNHVFYCSTCFDEKKPKTCECGVDIESTLNVMFC